MFRKIYAMGGWLYAADNGLAAIQSLAGAESVMDTFAVRSTDGTSHNSVITLGGVDEFGDIRVSWVAPAE